LAGRARATIRHDEFNGVAALSATDAWAVGNICHSDGCPALLAGGPTLIAHWNGTKWSRVPSPNDGTSFLAGVAAASPTDIWAVGFGADGPLILHWNGAAWSIVPNPAKGTNTELAGVAAVSGSDAWAVGHQCISACGKAAKADRTLILHWNGKTWTQIPSPSPNPLGNPILAGVAAVSSTDAWAVGDYCASACGKAVEVDHTLILHWDGNSWAQAPSPSPARFPVLSAVTATSATDAWAVGDWCVSACGTGANVFHALLLHWNGQTWTEAPSPSANTPFVFGASSTSGSNAWAVGGDIHAKSVTLHWNGAKWSKVPSPSPQPFVTLLLGSAATSATDAWAVGESGFFGGSLSTVIMHWNGTAWSLVPSPNP
jgi:hypothetical protein